MLSKGILLKKHLITFPRNLFPITLKVTQCYLKMAIWKHTSMMNWIHFNCLGQNNSQDFSSEVHVKTYIRGLFLETAKLSLPDSSARAISNINVPISINICGLPMADPIPILSVYIHSFKHSWNPKFQMRSRECISVI